ncbi:Hypothetical protein A7982_02118 [Minicystis rosea]|nr:Hypothetical protein A7982_02118 [Minicystis rosea]
MVEAPRQRICTGEIGAVDLEAPLARRRRRSRQQRGCGLG